MHSTAPHWKKLYAILASISHFQILGEQPRLALYGDKKIMILLTIP